MRGRGRGRGRRLRAECRRRGRRVRRGFTRRDVHRRAGQTVWRDGSGSERDGEEGSEGQAGGRLVEPPVSPRARKSVGGRIPLQQQLSAHALSPACSTLTLSPPSSPAVSSRARSPACRLAARESSSSRSSSAGPSCARSTPLLAASFAVVALLLLLPPPRSKDGRPSHPAGSGASARLLQPLARAAVFDLGLGRRRLLGPAKDAGDLHLARDPARDPSSRPGDRPSRGRVRAGGFWHGPKLDELPVDGRLEGCVPPPAGSNGRQELWQLSFALDADLPTRPSPACLQTTSSSAQTRAGFQSLSTSSRPIRRSSGSTSRRLASRARGGSSPASTLRSTQRAGPS